MRTDQASRLQALVAATEPDEILRALTRLSDDPEGPAPTPSDLAQVWSRCSEDVHGKVDQRLARVYGNAVQVVALKDPNGLARDLMLINDHDRDGRDQHPRMETGIQALHARWVAHGTQGRRVAHPIAPLIQTWTMIRPRRVEAFRPTEIASLPRFHRTTPAEAGALSQAGEPSAPGGKGTAASETLPLDPEMDLVDSSPGWLQEMFAQAARGRVIRRGMPWGCTLVFGALLHSPIDFRDGRETTVTGLDLDEVIGWIHAKRWGCRAAQWNEFEAAFDEMASYRITVAGYRYWVAIGESLPTRYRRGAAVTFRTRVPASAAHGTRLDWPTLVSYRRSALMTRAYLAVRTLLDRSARNGQDITRHIIGPSGRPQKNRAARFAPLLPNGDVARFMGMADNKSNRYVARAALQRLQDDGEIEIVEDRRGYRVFGVHRTLNAMRPAA